MPQWIWAAKLIYCKTERFGKFMVTKKILSGKNIFLRQIEMDDCSVSYVNWLNDSEVTQYLETKWVEQTMETIQNFVESQRENNHSVLFAIISKESNLHIGNIKIGPVNEHHKHADISYFIGNKAYWNKGIATETIRLICKFGFEELGLNKVEAGAYETAVASWKALEKNGFKREGVLREQAYLNDRYIAVFRYGLLKKEWESEYYAIKG